jgi:hypothetical protein
VQTFMLIFSYEPKMRDREKLLLTSLKSLSAGA